MSIFSDMIEDFMEVFTNDLTVFGDSFDGCLENLGKFLARCEAKNLVLNWEKCHLVFSTISQPLCHLLIKGFMWT